ncbi:alkyl/aryl-sulfatase [Acinetobacter marinus]|uniref:alkyl/aryl-sulfatase n=1 Tax=Acinetobacter marinus TaxID=281375 RepID=UPI000B889FAE|nr:alkyl sulfatase dimerization domain-containing protein [Acinetobacter marinus]
MSADSLAQGQATAATIKANNEVIRSLPFNDTEDFKDATRGLIDKPESLIIKDAKGNVVWDMDSYTKFIGMDKPAPATVNPSLWRNAQLNVQYGLFKVTDNIFQVRGYDISNITFVKGKTGWIVFDPGTASETAKAAYDLVTKNLGKRPIKAVIYSHSHVDHYAGVKGIVDEADVKSGKVKIIAPEGFLEHAVSEMVIAGNAMSRRAIFMYGALLPRSATGGVNAGLGQTNPVGNVTLIAPTDTIKKTGETMTVDGVKMEFQMTPGTEAPAEMNTWFPEWNALWMAENTTNTMHNVLTLRGAQVRDPLVWSKYLNETIDMYGKDVQVKFQSHHWPMWGNEKVVDYFKKQRDVYKYTHDQSVNLLNKGYTSKEISEMIHLPDELDKFWPNRGYYGTLRHNSRAVYQRYMGWYDANPSSLNDLPPADAAKKYVEYMGGASAVMSKAKADYDKGEYRWVAEALKQVVFADPNNTAAKNLLADAYEQLGFQAEAGTWRSVYLEGAYELRNGTPISGGVSSSSPDTISAMTPDMLFDYLAVRLNGPKAAGKKMYFNIEFPDLKENYGLSLENAVLNYGKEVESPTATLVLDKSTLDDIQNGKLTLAQAAQNGSLKISGDANAFQEFLGMLDTFPFLFNIVTP